MSVYWDFEISVSNESNVIEQEQKKHERQDKKTQAKENQKEKTLTKKSQEKSNLEESEEKVEERDSLTIDSTKLKILDKNVDCYVLKTKKKSQFVAWWTTTKWFYNNEEKSIRLRKKIRWKSKKKASQWKQFYEKTTIAENVSKVICRRCLVVLTHFFIDIENSIMITHLTSIKCLKIFKKKNLKKLSKKFEFRATIKELS
jgi:hypothetical protein